jgi:hypothetical protein
MRKAKPNWKKECTLLREQLLAQEQEIAILRTELAGCRNLPTFDKDLLMGFLEVLYATKGGMARWGR